MMLTLYHGCAPLNRVWFENSVAYNVTINKLERNIYHSLQINFSPFLES